MKWVSKWSTSRGVLHPLQVAGERGLILVDTKYEFGKDSDGNILLVDELHTPDSSRYWIKVKECSETE